MRRERTGAIVIGVTTGFLVANTFIGERIYGWSPDGANNAPAIPSQEFPGSSEGTQPSPLPTEKATQPMSTETPQSSSAKPTAEGKRTYYYQDSEMTRTVIDRANHRLGEKGYQPLPLRARR